MKNNIKNSLLVVILVFINLMAFGQSEIERTFTGINKLDISTTSGDCIIKKGKGNDVYVKVEHSFSDDFEPDIEKKGNKLYIKEEGTNDWKGNALWTIEVPDNLDVRFNSGSGKLEISNLELELTTNTGSGALLMRDVKGEVSSNSGSGSAELTDCSGEISVNSGSGNIDVQNAEGIFSFNSGSGNIRLDNTKGEIGANSGSGNVKANEIILTNVGGFNSGSGNVSVILSETPNYNLSVNSGSGNAQLDFNGNNIKGTVVMGANKKKGKIIAPFEFDKVEEIKEEKGYKGDQIYIKKTAKITDDNIKITVNTGSGIAKLIK